MLVFTHPDLITGALGHSITRKDGNQYSLVLSKPSGLVYTREISRLDISTPPSWKPFPLSPNGRPYLWLDCSPDRPYGGPNGVLTALVAADPKPIVKLTGRTQIMTSINGSDVENSGPREVREVELLLAEDELLHSCYYCDDLEMEGNGGVAFLRIGGRGYTLTYGCPDCMHKSWIARTMTSVSKQWKEAKRAVGVVATSE